MAEADQVRTGRLEVLFAPQEGESEDSGVEIQAALPVGGDARDVIYAVQLHLCPYLSF
jgi:hypothetical protein